MRFRGKYTHFREGLHEFLGSDVRKPLEFHVSQLLRQHSGRWTEFGDVHLKDENNNLALKRRATNLHFEGRKSSERARRVLIELKITLKATVYAQVFKLLR